MENGIRSSALIFATIVVNIFLNCDSAYASGNTGVCKAHFSGKPKIVFNDDGRTFTLNDYFSFTDIDCSVWTVPPGAVVDGASIPRSLWSIVGGPLEGQYRNASIIHDWFCDKRSRPWKSVHRMFFDAMISSGVPEVKAKIMYLAVYLEGPRWSDVTVLNVRSQQSNCQYCMSVDDNQSRDLSSDVYRDQKLKNPVEHVTVVSKYESNSPDQFNKIASMIADGELKNMDEIDVKADLVRPIVHECPYGTLPTQKPQTCERSIN